uniref:EPM2A-interacting protein 1 n=1 Tax=Sipha flava TaxID=143950 RepID=A0A2S2PYG0_9HEMI
MCLICRKTVAVFKEYNVNRHYETKHNDYLKLSSEVKQSKLREFMSQLKSQQKMFSLALQQPSNVVKASYSVSFLIAKKIKKFSDGEFVKECLEAVAKDILPDKNKLFSNINLSRQTVCRRINDISNEIIVKLRDRIQDFKYFSIAFVENTDISDTAQLIIFVREVNGSFQITEKMLKLISLKELQKVKIFFTLLKTVYAKTIWIWKLFLEYQLMVHLLWLVKKKEL